MKKIKNNQKGFTLIEILLVVGFIALAGIGVYIIYNKVNHANIANQEARHVNVLRVGIKNIYAGSYTYNGVTTAALVNAKIAPEDMKQNGGTDPQLFNGFGGNVEVAANTYNGAVDKAFTISYAGIPKDICGKFVSLVSNDSVRVTVNSVVVKEALGTEGADKVQTNVPLVVEECDKAVSSTVVLTFL